VHESVVIKINHLFDEAHDNGTEAQKRSLQGLCDSRAAELAGKLQHKDTTFVSLLRS
jgi:hypothetical protein